MNLSVAVMAHPARAEQATALAEQLDATVVWDDGGGEWATGAAAWAAHGGGATHHMVVQDDAVLCRDLPAGVVAALPRLPAGDLMSLYFGHAEAVAGRPGGHALTVKAAAEAYRRGASWLIVPGAWWGVALVAPTEAVGPMLDWCAGRREAYDMRIAYWCQVSGRDVWHTWPSLVDHADGPSLVRPGRRPGRRAWQFVGVQASALSFDPAGPVVRVGTTKRPSSISTRAGLASHQPTRGVTMATPRRLHDPYRQRQLDTYLQRRRRQQAEQEPAAAAGAEGEPPTVAAPQPAPQPQPTVAVQTPPPGPTLAPPPESGKGSGADNWREFLARPEFGYDPGDLAGMGRDELIALYHRHRT